MGGHQAAAAAEAAAEAGAEGHGSSSSSSSSSGGARRRSQLQQQHQAAEAVGAATAASAAALAASASASAAAVASGRTVLDCGDAGGGALVMGRGGFVLRDLMFTRCGGPAPVLVNFTVAGAEGSSGSGSSIAPAAGSNSMVKGGWLEGCVFEANAGFVAGEWCFMRVASEASEVRVARSLPRRERASLAPIQRAC